MIAMFLKYYEQALCNQKKVKVLDKARLSQKSSSLRTNPTKMRKFKERKINFLKFRNWKHLSLYLSYKELLLKFQLMILLDYQ